MTLLDLRTERKTPVPNDKLSHAALLPENSISEMKNFFPTRGLNLGWPEWLIHYDFCHLHCGVVAVLKCLIIKLQPVYCRYSIEKKFCILTITYITFATCFSL